MDKGNVVFVEYMEVKAVSNITEGTFDGNCIR